jgi:hypothetical protein
MVNILNYKSKNFIISSYQKRGEIVLFFLSRTNIISTKKLPKVADTIEQVLPSVFNNTCYNDQGKCFKDEVKNTETAHLLEHLIIEFMIQKEKNKGNKTTIRALTSWNWNKNPFGSFKITIKVPQIASRSFKDSFHSSISLLEKILDQANGQPHQTVH